METSTIVQPRTSRLSLGTLRVDVISGPAQGAATTLDAEQVSVGSAKGNTIVVGDPTVSRFHLELWREGGDILATDLGSTNGTYVGPVRVERVRVPPGTVLRLGNTELRIAHGADTEVPILGEERLAGVRGKSPHMQRLMLQLERVAQGAASVLLIGESGTGKEVTARAIHELSPRAAGPFVTVDCGSIPPTLLASELFGHERGAFTGADRQHVGAFERASGGSVLLDEIGELPAEVQATLLGVLERKRYRRVGGQQELSVDARVIAATHRDLRAGVNGGTFRLDLYYRLAVVVLRLPPLRERPEDIPLLVEHFVRELGYLGSGQDLLGADVMAMLQRQSWPGNVRELRNAVEAMLLMGESHDLGLSAGPGAGGGGVQGGEVDLDLPYKEARAEVTRSFEDRYLRHLLTRAEGNVSRAARIGQMDRSHLIELLRRHQIRS
ncbi:MAG: sigma 54-dependent Fis family transcriptional regulator [Myxococcales bacterium]|nr:sigma 54-dependent Fis family transcriptional regulator [Myxococcales bacterium]HRC55987.1 sigma 54-interacting transcriptional regulator [Kofleriaceae bacterium]